MSVTARVRQFIHVTYYRRLNYRHVWVIAFMCTLWCRHFSFTPRLRDFPVWPTLNNTKGKEDAKKRGFHLTNWYIQLFDSPLVWLKYILETSYNTLITWSSKRSVWTNQNLRNNWYQIVGKLYEKRLYSHAAIFLVKTGGTRLFWQN